MRKFWTGWVAGCCLVASSAGAGPPPLILDWGVVDTAGTTPQAASRAVRSGTPVAAQKPTVRGTSPWLVQFNDVIRPEGRKSLEAAGAKIKGYIPENAFLVEATPGQMAAIGAMPEVAYAGEFRAEYKRAARVRAKMGRVARGEEADAPTAYRVLLFSGDDLAGVARRIEALTGRAAAAAEGGQIRTDLTAAQIEEITGWGEVHWVEPYTAPRLWNNVSVRTNLMNVSNVWSGMGLTGAGQTIAVCDTGLDTGNTTTLHKDFTNRVTGYGWTNGVYNRRTSWADYNSHGTHVAGSVLGNGTMSTGLYKGVAYAANLLMQGMQANLSGIPDDLATLFKQAYDNKARIHSDSWGYDDYGYYNSDSRAVDQYVWSNKTMLILFSAGNSGTDANSDGIVDPDSVGSPGTAKNCLTVGAAENYRLISSTYGDAWPADFSAEPIKSDNISQPATNNIQGLAAFSSRGPCDDGRIKPDLVAPGTYIISTRSRATTNTGWGVSANTNYLYNGGTSMATPLTAGAAALARQWVITSGGVADPTAALLKALLLNGARNMAPGQYGTGAAQEIPAPRPSGGQGWGHVDLYNTLKPASTQILDLYDSYSLGTGQTNTFTYTVDAGSTNKFILTMVYADYWGTAGSGKQLVNDLDLTVVKPSGATNFANGRTSEDATNNVEMIEFAADEAGTYTIRVAGRNVPSGGTQSYALVVRGPKRNTSGSSRPGLGAIPYADTAGTGVTFRTWAPFATSVSVRGDFNSWGQTELYPDAGGGTWSVDIPNAAVGDKYKFYLNGTTYKRDPHNFSVENSAGSSIIYDHKAFDWGAETNFSRIWRNDLVIYEMHAGSYNAEDWLPSTFDECTEKIAHLKALGVSAVQVMPVNEFAGDRSWGYNPADPFAIESAFGGADGFKRFVRTCHTNGIAVLVDVVHNHYGPSDLDLWQFDGWSQDGYGGIYFYNDWRAVTDWGNTRPDYGRAEVRDYIKAQIQMFVEDYHIDGFRWDSIYNIRYASGTWNQTGSDMLAEINNWLINYHPDLFRISEDHAFDTDVGFEAQWDHGFLNDIRYLATAANDADRNMDTLAGYLRDTGLDRVVYPESHDSCGDLNSKNRLPYDINSGDPAGYYAKKRALLAHTISLVTPGIPMIFEGSEMHEWYQFSDGTALRWSLTNTYAGIVRAYGDLIRLRRNANSGTNTAALKNANNVNVHHVDNINKVVGMIRWDQGGQTDDIVVAINCSATAYGSYGMAFPSAGTWTCLYNSDSTNYNAEFGNVGPAVGGTVVADGNANATLALGAYSMQIYYKEATEASSAAFDPAAPSGCGSEVTITYSPGDGVLSGAAAVYAYIGQNNWQNPASNLMTAAAGDWTLDYTIPADTYELNIVFTDGEGTWDNNGGSDWKVAVSDCGTPPVGTETEYWRGDAGLNNNWANTDASGINNWWRSCDGWTVRRPDLASNAWSATGVRSYNTLVFDNDQRTAMAVNNDADTGVAEFQVHQIQFANAADRSLTQGNGAYLKMGGGTNNAKIEATSPNGTGTYTFNVPLLLDKTTELNPVAGNLTFNSAITNGGYGIEVYGSNGKTLALAGDISGAGGLTVNQNSLVVLSGSNTYGGGTEVDAGTLQIGAGGDAGSVAGNITNHAAVVFDRTGAASYSGILSGSGTLTKKGAGVLTLSGPNSYAGATYIEGGAVTVVPGGALGDGSDVYLSNGAVLTAHVGLAVGSLRERGSGNGGTAAIAAGAVLTVTGADKGTFYMGAISGAGNLALAGSGTTRLQLYGEQTYTGDTLIHSAILGLQPDTTLASLRIVIGTNATFDVATRTGGLTFNSGQGLLVLASSSNAPARINTVTNNGLVAAADSAWVFGAFSTNGGPPLLVVGDGELVLAAGNTVVVTNIGEPLVAGAYKLIAKDGNSVAGAAPTNVAVAGNGLDTNSALTASLSIAGGELFLEVSGPTRVVLYGFTAGDENGQVVVRWRTASEENTVGFFVERWDGRQWVRVNEAIVYAAGADGFGASYALVDAQAAAGGTYLYRLVEIETDGDRQTHGPFERTATALKFQSPVVLDANAVLIRWLSREGECYRILRSTNLTEGFRPIASGLPATPPENEYRDEAAGGLGMYLIQVDGD